jgi:hypothetical protein
MNKAILALLIADLGTSAGLSLPARLVGLRGVSMNGATAAAGGGGMARAGEDDSEETLTALVADDEYLPLTLELSGLVRELVTSKVRAFTDKPTYSLGDLSIEIDRRIKAEVATLRKKDDYEIGDLTLALDEMAKGEVARWAGKAEYETGDISREIARRTTHAVYQFAGEAGSDSLRAEIARRNERIAERVREFTGKPDYQLGDIARELSRRRKSFLAEHVGDDGYQLGEISRSRLRKWAVARWKRIARQVAQHLPKLALLVAAVASIARLVACVAI